MVNIGLFFSLFLLPSLMHAQATASANPSSTEADIGTSNDLFVMFGSDLVRPGLEPKANDNIGLGHTFAFLKKDPSATRSRLPAPTKTPALMDSCILPMAHTLRPWGS